MTHTPLPWRYSVTGELYSGDVKLGSLTASDEVRFSEQDENGAFIVRACNGWNDLNALRERLKELEADNASM